MNLTTLKATLIGLLMIWLLLFAIDSIFGITWPNYMIHRVFVWTPTALIGVYWLTFGGAKKKK
ncbi:hypothetical protein [Ghiorsea bivora]|uniref:hypothetical protein n=1 Tax=Ghiorsea bivora TaxID=1485545 RepID=UPI000570FEDE|nr:hypothetical protein [Ghiorsea bivora]